MKAICIKSFIATVFNYEWKEYEKKQQLNIYNLLQNETTAFSLMTRMIYYMVLVSFQFSLLTSIPRRFKC